LNERYLRVFHFTNALRALATNGGLGDIVFEVERQWLLEQPDLKKLIPKFLHLCRSGTDFWPYIKGVSPTYQGRREHIKEIFEPMLAYLEAGNDSPVTESLKEVFDHDALTGAWHKALERKDLDPDGAITVARSIVESVCKHILDDLQVSYTDKDDITGLYGKVAKELKLSPDQDLDAVLRQVLSGCHSIVSGLAGLRNKIGDAHGQGKRARKAKPRHAELSINIAGALSMFLLRTYRERNQ
jgi:hypothetical protein